MIIYSPLLAALITPILVYLVIYVYVILTRQSILSLLKTASLKIHGTPSQKKLESSNLLHNAGNASYFLLQHFTWSKKIPQTS